jgi:phosphinothricin acetyltransferase
MNARPATSDDAAAIAAIYNQGIEERIATFETRLRIPDDIHAWLDGRHPVVVVEDHGAIVAFAATSVYRPRECYAGIAEFSIYVARDQRRKGYGRGAMVALCEAAERAGFWKLVSRVFPENTSSRAMLKSLGFREVGTYRCHGKVEGRWRDAVIVEKLLGEATEAGQGAGASGGAPTPSG